MQRRIPRFQDLLVNDPKLVRFDLWLHHAPTNDWAIAQALRQNDYVTDLSIFLVDHLTAWPHVCEALSTRRALTKVSLRCGGSSKNKKSSSSSSSTQLALLEAIGHNPHVEKIMVDEVQLTREALQLCLDMGTNGAAPSLMVEFRGCSSPLASSSGKQHFVQGILY